MTRKNSFVGMGSKAKKNKEKTTLVIGPFLDEFANKCRKLGLKKDEERRAFKSERNENPNFSAPAEDSKTTNCLSMLNCVNVDSGLLQYCASGSKKRGSESHASNEKSTETDQYDGKFDDWNSLKRCARCMELDLKRGGFRVSEFRAAGYTPQHCLELGFDFTTVQEAFSLDWFELKHLSRLAIYSKVPVEELRKFGGFSARHLKSISHRTRETKGPKRRPLFSAADLKAGGYSLHALKQAGFPAKELKLAGFPGDAMRHVGFKKQDLEKAGYTEADISDEQYAKYKDSHDYQQELPVSNVDRPTRQRLTEFLKERLISAGYTPKEFKEAGFAPSRKLFRPEQYIELKDAGFDAADFYDEYLHSEREHFKVSICIDELGFTRKELKEGGYPASSFKEAGCTIRKWMEVHQEKGKVIAFQKDGGQLCAADVDAGTLEIPSDQRLHVQFCDGDHLYLFMRSPEDSSRRWLIGPSAAGTQNLLGIGEERSDGDSFIAKSTDEVKEFRVVRPKGKVEHVFLKSSKGGYVCIENRKLFLSEADDETQRAKVVLQNTFTELHFQKSDMKRAGFPAAEFLRAGYSVTDCKDVGFTIRDMKNGGYGVAELKKIYSLKQFKNLLGRGSYSPLEFKKAGFKHQEFKDAGFSVKDQREAEFTVAELRNLKYTTKDLKEGSFTAKELLEADPTNPDLPAELKTLGYKVKDFKEAGWDAAKCKEQNFTWPEIVEAGFTLAQVKESAGGVKKNIQKIVKELKDYGFKGAELCRAGFTPGDMAGIFSVGDLVNEDVKILKLKEYGWKAYQLIASGKFTAKDCKEAGFSLLDLFDAGVSRAEALKLFTKPEVKDVYGSSGFGLRRMFR